MGFGVWGLVFGVSNFRYMVQGYDSSSGFRIQGFRVKGSGFRVLEFRV